MSLKSHDYCRNVPDFGELVTVIVLTPVSDPLANLLTHLTVTLTCVFRLATATHFDNFCHAVACMHHPLPESSVS